VHRVGYSRDKDELKEKWGKEDLGGREEERKRKLMIVIRHA
jgi:hypothetical protein